MKSLHKVIIKILLTASLVGCATPATKQIELDEKEVHQERQKHHEMVKNEKPKKIVRKHKEVSYYHQRLEKIAPRLTQAAQKLCKKGDCNYKFQVIDKDMMNAWADGKTVNITPIMMDFLETEKELATVMSHELAHNLMGHIGKKTTNSIIGTLFDVAAGMYGVQTYGAFGGIGAHSYSQGFENEADYVAIYIMANAGYDISDVHNVWRKMSTQNTASIEGSFFSSHPSNPERFLRMKKAIDEVNAKKVAGQKLEPNVG